VPQLAGELQEDEGWIIDEREDASAKTAGAQCTHPYGESLHEHVAWRLATDGREQ